MICKRKGCGREFAAKTHNQKYCTSECTSIATNERLKQQYHERKAAKAARHSGERRCDECNALLSRYNHDETCQPCLNSMRSGLAYLGLS